MRIGPVEISTISEWEPSAGALISWHASPASRAKALAAPVSAVPPSYIQTRHLRSFSQQAARGLEHSRLLIASCEVFGRCDVRAMTYVINAHLRRHDTYRSWFEYQDADHILRHTMAEAADIEFVATEHGEKNIAELRDHILATPDSLQWDCFSFGIIQGADRFTFYASVDHLHADGQFVGVGLMEFQSMYLALAMGEPPVGMSEGGSYDDYCVRQRRYTTALTLDSPKVRTWVDFAEANDGTFPKFPLPLGDPSVPCNGDLISATLLDKRQTEKFDAACTAADTRFIGGMFACIALALQEVIGAQTGAEGDATGAAGGTYGTYAGLTPKDTRTPEDLATQGWFTGRDSGDFSRHRNVFRRNCPGRAAFLRLGRGPGESAVRTRGGAEAVAGQAAAAVLVGELLRRARRAALDAHPIVRGPKCRYVQRRAGDLSAEHAGGPVR